MPEYRTGEGYKGTMQSSAANKYLNLKRAFDDAVRQQQWKLDQDWRNNQSRQNEQRTQSATTLASQGMMSPEQYQQNTSFKDPYSGQQVPGMQMSQPTSGDLVYRDSLTGEDVPAEVAVPEIQGGEQKYKVYKNVHTRSGIRETLITAPPKLTEADRTYLTATKRMQKRLGSITETIDSNFKTGKWGLFQTVQANSVPYVFVGSRAVQRFKNDLNSLKADIPFLRGGKQLTPMEAKRVDILLTPVGKYPEEYKRDIQIFQEEFLTGEQIIKFGVRGLEGKPFEQNQQTDELSNMSDDELRAIINGK